MRILEGDEAIIAYRHLELAKDVATQATCARAKCGSVIVTGREAELGHTSKLLGFGWNRPPRNTAPRCHRKAELKPGFKSDRTCCIHAEQRAILHALANGAVLEGSRLYFVRLDAQGDIAPSGQPYCTICSKMVLDAGVAEFVLVHQTGITVYGAEEYNDLSFAYDGEGGGVKRCRCGDISTHVENFYEERRFWCNRCVPMSGHYEVCPEPCRSMLAKLMSRDEG